MKVRVLIADDEPLARSRLVELVSQESDVEVIGQCRNGLEAVAAIKEKKPDLVFLDIRMPGLDGIEVLRSLDQSQLPAVIFVTAYDKHAVEAFDLNAVDYLLKPYQPERFKRALQRAREHLQSGTSVLTARLLRLLETEKPAEPSLTRFSIKAGGKTQFVAVKEVEWIEAAGNYLILHVAKENHLVRDTLAGLESKLPPKHFIRVNRSALVNLERVKEIEPTGNDTHVLTLRSGAKLTATRSVREIEELLKFG
jgi:two-component system, LytTR family, response regulator